ncbi:very short patch repair endonuclease [Terrabacter sp. 2RAF25]|uniref:very short patch repair endonuclease n=1 Tax=Terrabacter sp. 2RAF25 TaxID=3232998 RepID=UPI003F9B2736
MADACNATPASSEPPRLRPDAATSAQYAARARRETSPELALRRELHRRGLRFRVQTRVSGLPRRSVDIAFTRWKVAVMVDGCFWHGCPDHGTRPSRNSDWWEWKLAVNRARDNDTDNRLSSLGWAVVRVWEHEEPAVAAERIEAALSQRGRGVPHGMA